MSHESEDMLWRYHELYCSGHHVNFLNESTTLSSLPEFTILLKKGYGFCKDEETRIRLTNIFSTTRCCDSVLFDVRIIDIFQKIFIIILL